MMVVIEIAPVLDLKAGFVDRSSSFGVLVGGEGVAHQLELLAGGRPDHELERGYCRIAAVYDLGATFAEGRFDTRNDFDAFQPCVAFQRSTPRSPLAPPALERSDRRDGLMPPVLRRRSTRRSFSGNQ